MALPAVLKILAVFAAMLVANRLGLSLGLALLGGAVAIDAWAGTGFAELCAHLGFALVRPQLWLLVIIVALILELARFTAEKRNADTIMVAARRWGGRHGRAASVMIIPAVIGLIPMPGGALFSAPMVEQAVQEERWNPAWKSAVNYWFRHVWEYWWPLYPVVIVTLSIFETTTWQYMAVMIPFTVLAFLSGYLFLVRPHLGELAGSAEQAAPDPRRLRSIFVPLAIIVGGALVAPLLLSRLAPGLDGSVRKMLGVLLGLVAGLVPVLRDSRAHGDAPPFAGLLSRKSANVLGTLAGVMVFQAMLETSGLLPLAGDEMVAAGIPMVAVAALLPFVAGLVTGIAIGFAGTAFPLIVGILAGGASGLTPLATLVLAFGFGYAGMMLSPVHLCFVLTRNYFSAPFRGIYWRITPCIIILLAAAVGAFVLFQRLGW